MDFELSEEQRLVQETFARFCDERSHSAGGGD